MPDKVYQYKILNYIEPLFYRNISKYLCSDISNRTIYGIVENSEQYQIELIILKAAKGTILEINSKRSKVVKLWLCILEAHDLE